MAEYTLSANEQKIIDAVSIPQYYNDQVVSRRQGFRRISPERPSGICPFHDDTDPSFHFWKEKKIYRCFGCGATGNVIGMHIRWMKEEYGRYMDKTTAIKELADMYGVELELDEKGNMKQESVFDIAKRNLLSSSDKPKGKMTVSEFRTFNNQIKGQLSRMSFADGSRASQMYYKLDLMLSSYLAEEKAKGLKS